MPPLGRHPGQVSWFPAGMGPFSFCSQVPVPGVGWGQHSAPTGGRRRVLGTELSPDTAGQRGGRTLVSTQLSCQQVSGALDLPAIKTHSFNGKSIILFIMYDKKHTNSSI